MNRRVLTLALATAIALAGCTAPDGPVGDEDGQAWLTIALDRQTLVVGDRLNVTVTFENKGTEPFSYDHPGCPPEAFAVNVSGAGRTFDAYTYGQEPLMSACVITNVTVEPGERITTTVHWNGHTTENAPDPHTGGAAAPGEYTVRAELKRADAGRTFATARPLLLQAS